MTRVATWVELPVHGRFFLKTSLTSPVLDVFPFFIVKYSPCVRIFRRAKRPCPLGPFLYFLFRPSVPIIQPQISRLRVWKPMSACDSAEEKKIVSGKQKREPTLTWSCFFQLNLQSELLGSRTLSPLSLPSADSRLGGMKNKKKRIHFLRNQTPTKHSPTCSLFSWKLKRMRVN